MKTNLHILTNLLSLVISVVILIGCAKEKTEKQSAMTQAIENDYLVNKVLGFSQMANDLNEGKLLKNAEKMPIDEAINQISATLNYIYGHHTASYGKFHYETITLRIPIIAQEEKTYLVDALAGYNDALTQIRAKIVLINGLNKKVLNIAFLDAVINESLNEIIVNFQMQVGTGNAPIIGSSGFNTAEQYWWVRESYNCFDGNNTLGGAPDVIEQRLMFKFIQAPPPNCRYWFPFTEIKKFSATSYIADGNGDNFCDYKIYYATGLESQVLTDTVQCLGIEANHPGIHEMDFYLNNLDQIIAEFLLASNKSMKGLYIENSLEMVEDIVTIKHIPQLTYGTKSIMCWDNDYPIGIE